MTNEPHHSWDDLIEDIEDRASVEDRDGRTMPFETLVAALGDDDGVPAYTVRAVRAGSMWELHIQGVGVTQTPDPLNLADAEIMVRDYLRLDDMPNAMTAAIHIGSDR